MGSASMGAVITLFAVGWSFKLYRTSKKNPTIERAVCPRYPVAGYDLDDADIGEVASLLSFGSASSLNNSRLARILHEGFEATSDVLSSALAGQPTVVQIRSRRICEGKAG
jgi:hypothetical protein